MSKDNVWFEFAPGVEMVVEDPPVFAPETRPSHGATLRGYIRFDVKKSSLAGVEGIDEDEAMCWPVWIGETQGGFSEGEKDLYYGEAEEGPSEPLGATAAQAHTRA